MATNCHSHTGPGHFRGGAASSADQRRGGLVMLTCRVSRCPQNEHHGHGHSHTVMLTYFLPSATDAADTAPLQLLVSQHREHLCAWRLGEGPSS